MEATTTARRRTVRPISHYWGLVKDMDDSQKLELITLLAESVKPIVTRKDTADDEPYTLRPFTMEELNAVADQAEADFAAGKGTPHEEVLREMDEEIERWEQEERQYATAQAI